MIALLLVVHPRIQERHERELAERLARLRDAGTVNAAVDGAIAQARGGTGGLRRLKRWEWPSLFR